MMQSEISLGMNAEIIYINFEPSLSDHVGKNAVHERLEGGRAIAESEEHYCGFEETKRCDECTLPLVFFLDSDVIISPPYIEFGEQGGILHIIDEFGNEG
jgi:hypothetical protein